MQILSTKSLVLTTKLPFFFFHFCLTPEETEAQVLQIPESDPGLSTAQGAGINRNKRNQESKNKQRLKALELITDDIEV